MSAVWLDPPATCAARDGGLRLRTRPETDFWQAAHYGFRRDDGHSLHSQWEGDFRAEAEISLQPTAKYDQAGRGGNSSLSVSAPRRDPLNPEPDRPS